MALQQIDRPTALEAEPPKALPISPMAATRSSPCKASCGPPSTAPHTNSSPAATAPVGGVVLATGRYIGEGFDDHRLDALLLAMPIAWQGTVVQYAGRLHRAHPGKQDVLIYDYGDAELPVLRRMFAKRLREYRSLGDQLAEPA